VMSQGAVMSWVQVGAPANHDQHKGSSTAALCRNHLREPKAVTQLLASL